MKTQYSILLLIYALLLAFCLIGSVYICFSPGGSVPIALVLVVGILWVVAYTVPLIKRIETTPKEFLVTYSVFPFIKHWYSFDDFDGFFVVKMESNKPTTEVFLVKNHKVKLCILLDIYKNKTELRNLFSQKIDFLGSKTSYIGGITYKLGQKIDY